MNISFLKEKGNKYLIYILLGLLVLIVVFPTSSSEETTVQTEVVSQDELEQRLENVLSAMEGVGKVEVMITTQSSSSSLFSETDEGAVYGVVVVAEGADDATVSARISEAVKALFSVDAHKISIVKMRLQEDNE